MRVKLVVPKNRDDPLRRCALDDHVTQGIAIAIGVLVDASIVVTENVIHHAEAYAEEHGGR